MIEEFEQNYCQVFIFNVVFRLNSTKKIPLQTRVVSRYQKIKIKNKIDSPERNCKYLLYLQVFGVS